MNELKVGEVISHKYKDKWYLWNVEKSPRSPMPNIFFVRSGRNTNFLHYDEEGDTWQRGIHPSLIPAGFVLVNEALPTKLQAARSLAKTRKKKIGSLCAEIQAARKENVRLENLISTHNEGLLDTCNCKYSELITLENTQRCPYCPAQYQIEAAPNPEED